MKRAEIEANARKPYADAILKLQRERDDLRQQNARLLEMLDNLCDRAQEWRATSGFVEAEALAIREARALLASIEGES